MIKLAEKLTMKRILVLVLFLINVALGACQQNSKLQNVAAETFDSLQHNLTDAVIIDVRTKEEFEAGHIKGAVLLDQSSDKFLTEIDKLNKNKSILVYCLSGGRSSSAASQIAQMGFEKVYNLEGGMMSWRAASKPEEKGASALALPVQKGLTQAQFLAMVKSDKMVLVDFNAVWCGLCKKLGPIVKKIAKKHSDKLQLIEIDVDANKDLAKEKGIRSIPYLELYQNGELVWKVSGFRKEKELIKMLKLD